MPQNITQYRVFIGSPGGLKPEREAFRKALEKCSLYHGDAKGIRFHPVGWEDTIGGAGRPQAHINEDLKQCDYAVFVLHDRWGSPTGNGASSGTKEEWDLAVELYKENKLRNIALFFKKVDDAKLADPGDQLKPVLAFKKEIEESKQYLFHSYQEIQDYTDKLDGFLAKWLSDHERLKTTDLSTVSSAETITSSPIATTKTVAPDFSYCFGEADRLLRDSDGDKRVALYFSQKAIERASNDLEWTKAQSLYARARFDLNELRQANDSLSEIISKIRESADPVLRIQCATAMYNKGVTLSALERGIEAIAAYDGLITRFGNAPELPLRERVARALYNKGWALGALQRGVEEIAAYDDLITRFGDALELPLREIVAKAMVNKGWALGALQRGVEEIAAYDDLINRFGGAPDLPLREQVAVAMFNKGGALGALKRGMEAIAVYDDLITRFGKAPELPLREQVAKAMVNKGWALGALQRGVEEIAAYDDLITRFGGAPDLPLREQVAIAMFNKGGTLGALKRGMEAISVYDDLITRFGKVPELPLREQVARAMVNKGATLSVLQRHMEAIAVYDELITRFGDAPEDSLKEVVERARKLRNAAKRK